jgi:hypothetical protein
MADAYSQTISGEAGAATLGDNSRKTDKTTRTGTPELTSLIVAGSEAVDYNNEGNWNTPNGAFSKAIRALQERVEIYHVHEPEFDAIHVQVRASSVPLSGSEALEDGGTNAVLGAAVTAALGASVNVWHANLEGDNILYD